jgi:hypothetical protein
MGAAIHRAFNLNSAEDADAEAPSGTLSVCQRLPLQVVFLEALYNYLEDRLKSLSEVDKTKWDVLRRQIEKLQSSLTENNADVISKAIDDCFKPFVQDDNVLMLALEAYLPDRDGTWEHFREIKLKSMNDRARRKFLENYDGQTEIALETLRRIVRMFAFAIKGVDANKKTDGEKIVDVFYAAHKDPMNENDIGQPCEQTDSLHYGREKVSIPNGHKAGISGTPWRKEDAEPNKHVMSRKEFQSPDEEVFVKKINESIQVITSPQTVILQTTLLFRTVGLRNT